LPPPLVDGPPRPRVPEPRGLLVRGLLVRGLRAPAAGAGLAEEADDLAEDLRAPPLRLAPLPADLARVPLDLALLPERFAEPDERLLDAVLRAPAAPVREERVPDDDALDVALVPSSEAAHLPDMTRCAASATASAISEPNLVALAIMLVAACDAVSAASSPASRIARRAFGLALIAAAAAARPAASISLLIAPLASFSTVLSPEPEVEPAVRELVLREDLAIGRLRPFASKDTQEP